MAAGILGSVSNTFSLRRFETLSFILLILDLNLSGLAFPHGSLSSPLLLDGADSEPPLVALRLDDLIGAYHRGGTSNLRSGLQRRGTSDDEDDDDAKLDALKAQLTRQAGEIGGLTEKLMHDDQQIVELRLVVCRLLQALCNNEGNPCLPCPWKDLPTEPPITTTTAATTVATSTTEALLTTTTTEPTYTTPPTTKTSPFTTTAYAPSKTTTTELLSTSKHPDTTSTIKTTVAPTTTAAKRSTTTVAPTTTSLSKSTTAPPSPPTTTNASPATTGSTTTKTTASSTIITPTTTESSTTASPTTTGAPTTTVAPTTTASPTSTVAPTTTVSPTTTVAPTTTTTAKPTPDPEAKCNDPKAPDNGYIVGNETKLGSHVEIKCKPGFTLVGVPQMECTALWSDETHSFSYNWAPPMSAVCKATSGYVASKPNKGKPSKNVKQRRKRSVSVESQSEPIARLSANEICAMPALVGPCRASFPRFFFNAQSGECEPFIFGGCMGNENNFVSRDHCHKICGSH